MYKQFTNKAKKYLINFIQAQLIVTIISLPILINAGLPLSKFSIVGNFIFTPILMLFLILSSLIFFTQICSIPNLFLITMLNNLTTFWEKILSYGEKSWLIGFTKTNILILISIPLATFFIISHKKINNSAKRIVAMLIILAFYTGFFYYSSQPTTNLISQKQQVLNDGKNKLFITQIEDGKLNLIDSGFFNRKKSIDKFIDFEIKPYLLKEFGTLKIKNISVMKVGISSLQAAIEICKTFQVDQVTIPIFKNKLDKTGWKNFFLLKEFLQKNNIKFIRIKRDQERICDKKSEKDLPSKII